jgi:glycosyltransferase involved in cell wall biosynthesis
MTIFENLLKVFCLSVYQRFKAQKAVGRNVCVKPTINLVTTWNERCGVASYSSFLVNELKRKLKMHVVQISETSPLNFIYFFVQGIKAGKSCDIVHVQFEYGIFSVSALLFYLGLLLSGSRVITTFHEVMRAIEAGIFGKYYAFVNKVICNLSDSIIVHTLASKEMMVKLYGAPRAKVRVIPMGCYENPLFLDKDECKAKLNLAAKKVITIPGFVRYSKGHDMLVELIPLLNKVVHLLIAGGPRVKQHESYYEGLKRRARQLGCIDRITFCDYVSDEEIPVVMNATDVAILPYRSVTQSGILHVLIAYNVPTLTSDADAFKEIKDLYNCIELFKTGDKQDLFAKLSSLLYNDEKQRQLKEQCKKMWEKTRWSSIAAKHVELYLSVLGLLTVTK